MQRCAFLQTQTTQKNSQYYEREARESWYFWRPIVERMASPSEMKAMSLDEIMEFNAAIDIQIKKIKDAQKTNK